MRRTLLRGLRRDPDDRAGGLARTLDYAAALVLVCVAAGVTWLLREPIGARVGTLFYVAVVLASLRGGFGAGLLALGASAVAIRLGFPDAVRGSVIVLGPLFLGTGAILALACSALRHARFAAERQARENARLRDLAEEAAAQAEEEAARAEEEAARAEDQAAQAALALRETEEARRRLREGEERLRLALVAGDFGVWDWDIPANRVTWSERVYAFHGVAPGGFGGRVEDFAAIVHPDDREYVGDSIDRAVGSCGDYRVEFRVVHPDGAVRWLATHGAVLPGADGRPARMLGVTWDVTDRRLAEQRLRQAQRLESVGRLAGGIAHEVNNQMSVVLGFAEFVLARGDLPPEVAEDVRHIRAAGERAAAVTGQLLAFSRRQMLRMEPLDLNEVIRAFARVLRQALGDRAELRLELDPALVTVRADKGQLEQVLLNVALNAADAMPDGGSLLVRTANVVLGAADAARHPGVAIRPGPYVQLTLVDSGQGMPPEVLAHVFEPFFTTKEVGRGSGLGLATVYGIVKQSGGYVWADSTPGQGTAVRIYLPHAPAAEPADAPAPEPRPRGSGRVLVVEDEPAVREVATRALEADGFAVLAAGSAGEALDLVRGGADVRLVITDLAMPGLNGRELAGRLAAEFPALPVLFISGYPDREVLSRGLLEPGRPFLQKPFAPETLARAVRALLDGSDAAAFAGS